MSSKKTINMLRMIGVAILLSSLSGCATMYSAANEETTSKMKRVGVVSLVGGILTRQYTGFTVFNNEFEHRDISGWKLDENYEEKIRNELQTKFGIAAITAPYSPFDFDQIDKYIDPWNAPLLEGGPKIDVAAALKSYCATNALDGVILVARTGKSFGNQVHQMFFGAVVYTKGGFQRGSGIYLVARLSLLECATGTRVVSRWLSADQSDPLKRILNPMTAGDYMRGVPAHYFDSKMALKPMDEWPPEVMQETQEKLLKIADRAFPVTLRSIFSAKPATAADAK
jgi:hypothetical protein